MKQIITLIIILTFSYCGYSQMYDRQVGIRLGLMSGITAKVTKNNTVAIQGTLGFRKGGVQVYTIVEKYNAIDNKIKNNWFFYFGGGAHTGYINGYNRVRRWSNTSGYYYEDEHVSGFVFGIDGVAGIEYRIPNIPLVLFSEFKPTVELQSFKRLYTNFYDFGIGLTYRFID